VSLFGSNGANAWPSFSCKRLYYSQVVLFWEVFERIVFLCKLGNELSSSWSFYEGVSYCSHVGSCSVGRFWFYSHFRDDVAQKSLCDKSLFCPLFFLFFCKSYNRIYCLCKDVMKVSVMLFVRELPNQDIIHIANYTLWLILFYLGCPERHLEIKMIIIIKPSVISVVVLL